MRSTLTTEGLRERFFLEKSPYWTVHNAARPTELMSKYRPDDNYAETEEEVLIFSWMQLEELFVNFSSGYGKVILRKNVNDNVKNSPTMYVKWGEDAGAGQRSVAGIGTTTSMMTNGPQQPTWAHMFDLQERNNQKFISLMETMMTTRFEKQRLEDEIEGMGAPSLKETLYMKGMDVAEKVLPRLLAGMTMPAPQGALGTIDIAPEPAPASPVGEGEPTPAGNDRPVSLDQLQIATQIISSNVPHHPNDVVSAIALFCKQQPEQAASYIDMLITQVKAGQNVG